ncbi:MAG: DNA polymerase I, partial [Bacteroidota bacterium]
RKIENADQGLIAKVKEDLSETGQTSLFEDSANTSERREANSSNPSAEKSGIGGNPSSSVNPSPNGNPSTEGNSAPEGYTLYQADQVKYIAVRDRKALDSCIAEFMKADIWSFDTETTSTDPQVAHLLGVALSHTEKEAWYISTADIGVEALVDALKPLFRMQSALKVAHHFKYDYRILRNIGVEVSGPIFDTMLAAYLLDAGQKMDMDSLARGYLGYEPVAIETLIGPKGRDQLSMKDVPLEKVVPYACEDADITLQLYRVLSKKIDKRGLGLLADDIEFPLARVLGKMESAGIKLDLDLLASFSEELDHDIETLSKQIYEMAGGEFNINSTKQLGTVLFEKLLIPSKKKTATGKYSTSEAVLSQLAPVHDIAALILEYRGLTKLKSTYVDALPKLVNERTGRIHSTFNQHITATGRLSSTHPNLQNIPVRTERGRGIRKAFVADRGHKILAADYSQIELRIIASISGDEAMIQAFRNNEDIHARTAAEIFGLDSLEEVDRDQRRKAKEVNFGIPYGVSAFGLAQRLGIPNKEGRNMIEAYFDRFPAIRDFINETIAFARDNGYVQTLSGRRRYVPDIHSRNPNIRGFAERTAVNMPIQGTAADLIKIAMINIDRKLADRASGTRMLMQVHDELVFEVPENEVKDVPEMVRDMMESAMELNVPLKVDTGVADNWLDAH